MIKNPQGTGVQSLIQEDLTCAEQLRPCITTTEPALQSLCSATREATAISPGTATREQLLLDATREKAKTK